MTVSVRGHFLWHELLTSDPEAAKAFYQKVVGWKTIPWTDPSYQIFMAGASPMGGLMAIPADMKAMGVPPHWKTFIGTDNVDETVRQAERLGGQLISPAMDLPEVGRFAIIRDPQGASVTVYTPGAPMTPTYPTPMGGFTWHELATLDWQAAWTFYSTLFGWRKGEAMDMGPAGMYQMFEIGGVVLGGIYNKPPETPVPSWLPYARIKDAKRAAAVTTAGGGKVLMGPMAVPGGTWIVMAMDPQGAPFAVNSDAVATSKPTKSAPTKASPPKKSAAKKPATKKPASKKAVTKKTAAKKPAAKKPASKKSAAKKKSPAKRKATVKRKVTKRR